MYMSIFSSINYYIFCHIAVCWLGHDARFFSVERGLFFVV
jgi:hypothetical protein